LCFFKTTPQKGVFFVLKMLKNKFDSVVFDVDSTLVKIEGLDFIAKKKGKGPEIEKITMDAMNGNILMEGAMKAKMEAIAPNYQELVDMGHAYIKNLTNGAREVVDILKQNGIKVWLITGNFQPAVGILAKHLKIDNGCVFSNIVYFDEQMNYKGFDQNNPLGKNGGKSQIIKKFKKEMKKVVFIGDGSTDAEAKNEVDLFIGFGGVVLRPKVQAIADIYLKDPNLKAILPFILG